MGGMFGGGGGGGVSIPKRNLTDELNKIFNNGVPKAVNAVNQFGEDQPLLKTSQDFALNNLNNVGDLTNPLMDMFKTLPGQVGGLENRLGGLYKNLPGVTGLTNPLNRMLGSLGGVYNSQIAPVLNTGGALTGEQARNTDQATRAAFAARGNALGNQALGTELLNRDQYRQNRFNNALTQGLGISGEQRGLTSGIEGLRSQDLSNRLGLTTAQGSLLGSQAALGSGLASGIQGLQGGALNQALGTEQAKVGDAMSIIAPVLGFGQDVFSSNQNAAAAQNIAGANKSSGALGGVLSAVGPILGAAISDKNLKTNIRPTKETTSEGIPIKTFSYRGDKRRFKGVIAQDVEKVRPDAVLTLPVTGHKLVNLAALAGASLEELHRYIPKAAHRG